MREIRYAFRSSNYHRKTKYILFFFSTLFLFLTTLVYTLIQVQKEYIQHLGSRWESLRNIVPILNEDNFLQIQFSNQQLLQFYQWVLYGLVLSFTIFLIISLVWIIISRKTESYRYIYLGMSLPKKMIQFSTEILLPMCYSFLLVTVALFIGHQSFMNYSEYLNEKLVISYYDQAHLENLYSAPIREKVPSAFSNDFQSTQTQPSKQDQSKDSKDCVMDFNKKTLFLANERKVNTSFFILFTTILKVFLWFLGIILVISNSLSYYAYRWSLRHINQFYHTPTKMLKEG